MQAACGSFRLQVVPYAPGTVGSIAGEEAGTNLGAQFFIAPAALTARPPQPGIEATPRDSERPRATNPPARSPVFAINPNFTSNSFAK